MLYSPRAIDTYPRRRRSDGKPTCSLCLEIYGHEIEMSGPVAHPTHPSADLYFVCERCNTAVVERRRRPPAEAAP
jgi:hypothetical protein